MSCAHTNPPGYVFCGKCGEALNAVHCRCGFVVAAGDAFCGRCGSSLSVETAKIKGGIDDDQRLDLELMIKQAAQEQQYTETTHKVRVTQDDIRKLLKARRKRF